MNASRIIVISLLILVFVGGGIFLYLSAAPAPLPSETVLPPKTTYRSLPNIVVLEEPSSNAEVGKEFLVKGKARGYWFFEASFPVLIIDSTGYTVAEGIAQAQSEWMTTEFVPFEVMMTLTSTPKSRSGVIRLKKDDPSGEHGDFVEVPIRFDATVDVRP